MFQLKSLEFLLTTKYFYFFFFAKSQSLFVITRLFLLKQFPGKSKLKEGIFTLEQINEVLNRVDPMFYQDIIEERSGNGYCGYLHCSNTPSNEKQQYRISITFNKVFEIDERKKYCSDVCFRRSMFLLGKMIDLNLFLFNQ